MMLMGEEKVKGMMVIYTWPLLRIEYILIRRGECRVGQSVNLNKHLQACSPRQDKRRQSSMRWLVLLMWLNKHRRSVSEELQIML
jgi:hypothetical protein